MAKKYYTPKKPTPRTNPELSADERAYNDMVNYSADEAIRTGKVPTEEEALDAVMMMMRADGTANGRRNYSTPSGHVTESLPVKSHPIPSGIATGPNRYQQEDAYLRERQKLEDRFHDQYPSSHVTPSPSVFSPVSKAGYDSAGVPASRQIEETSRWWEAKQKADQLRLKQKFDPGGDSGAGGSGSGSGGYDMSDKKKSKTNNGITTGPKVPPHFAPAGITTQPELPYDFTPPQPVAPSPSIIDPASYVGDWLGGGQSKGQQELENQMWEAARKDGLEIRSTPSWAQEERAKSRGINRYRRTFYDPNRGHPEDLEVYKQSQARQGNPLPLELRERENQIERQRLHNKMNGGDSGAGGSGSGSGGYDMQPYQGDNYDIEALAQKAAPLHEMGRTLADIQQAQEWANSEIPMEQGRWVPSDHDADEGPHPTAPSDYDRDEAPIPGQESLVQGMPTQASLVMTPGGGVLPGAQAAHDALVEMSRLNPAQHKTEAQKLNDWLHNYATSLRNPDMVFDPATGEVSPGADFQAPVPTPAATMEEQIIQGGAKPQVSRRELAQTLGQQDPAVRARPAQAHSAGGGNGRVPLAPSSGGGITTGPTKQQAGMLAKKTPPAVTTTKSKGSSKPMNPSPQPAPKGSKPSFASSVEREQKAVNWPAGIGDKAPPKPPSKPAKVMTNIDQAGQDRQYSKAKAAGDAARKKSSTKEVASSSNRLRDRKTKGK